MKKIVIYRDKKTNDIVNFHEYNEKCTPDNVQKYNSNENHTNTVEVIELNEIAEYFYNLKTLNIHENIENLRQIQEDLEYIASRIDNRLDDIEDLLKENKEVKE